MRKIKIAAFGLWMGLFLFAGFFGFIKNSSASYESLVISEAAAGIGGAGNEFVELYNMGSETINLKDEGIKLKLINSEGAATKKTISWKNEIIPAGGYFLFGAGALAISLDATYGGTLLTENGGVMITDKNDNIVDSITWVNLSPNSSIERIVGNFAQNDDLAFEINQHPNPQNSFYQDHDNEEDEYEPDPEDDEASDDENEDGEVCVKNSADVKINEIFPYPEKDEDEFVELINIGETCVDLSAWKITDDANHKYTFPKNTIVEAGEIIFVKQKLYLNNDTDTVFLFNSLGEVDKISYNKAVKNNSYSFDGKNWIWTPSPTPGEENEFNGVENEEDKFEGGEYNIRLNEVLPNPKGDEKKGEYVEIYNGESFAINLKDWILKDSSKTKFAFSKEYMIAPDEYLAIYRDVFKFALNNSGGESVYLMDPDENTISSVTYESAKEDISYSFNGSAWNWSKYLTPGKENKFNSAPKVELKKVKSGYVGMPVYFEAKVKSKDKNELKYRWDFDDGSRSYLQNVNHAFKKTGTYKVKFTVDDGGSGVEKDFKIKIKKYPKTVVEIVRLLPNPAGNDTGAEWIEIKNNSSKKINLKGWKIATGQKNLVNHSISDDIEIPAGDIFQLTREHSLFYLNNKEANIELRYPDGKTAAKISYKKDKIEEDEICLNKDGNCTWILSKEENEEEIKTQESPVEDEEIEVFESELSKINFSEDFLRENKGKLSKEESDLIKKIYQVHLAKNNSEKDLIIDLSDGKNVVYQDNNNYRFTHTINQPHWAVELVEDIKVSIFVKD